MDGHQQHGATRVPALSGLTPHVLRGQPVHCSLRLLHTQVANAVFSFPLAKYAKDGFDLVVGGSPERVMAGDAWGKRCWKHDILAWSCIRIIGLGCKMPFDAN